MVIFGSRVKYESIGPQMKKPVKLKQKVSSVKEE